VSERLDVVGIGNALVDVLSHESPEFITAQGLTPGAMTLIDTERAEQLYAAMGPAVEISGGSAANTLVGVTSMGGSAAFVGRVADAPPGWSSWPSPRQVGSRAGGASSSSPPTPNAP